jgi:hypothetical protein
VPIEGFLAVYVEPERRIEGVQERLFEGEESVLHLMG